MRRAHPGRSSADYRRAVVEVSNAQRRFRMAIRHSLAPKNRASSMVEVAAAVGAIHATDPTTVFLSTWARLDAVTRDDIEAALYEDRSVVRVMGMRRTLFVVTLETFPLVDKGAARDLADRERRRLVKLLGEQGIASDPARWLRTAENATLTALEARGVATAGELAGDVPQLQEKIVMGAGKWAADVAMSTRIAFLLATEGKIVRGRPRGTWLSSQWRWCRTEDWIDLPPEPSAEDARAGLLRVYLERFGPVTENDVVWWTGWTKSMARAALANVDPLEVDLETGKGFLLSDDLEESGDPGPWVALLPGLDSTIMGWKERAWYLGPHGPMTFDSNGNSGPVVVVDGRVVGAWAQASDGSVVYDLLEEVASPSVEEIGQRAAELTEWLGGRVVMPRFRSPLHRRLANG